MIGWIILALYIIGAALAGTILQGIWEHEFGKPKDFMDWFGGVFWAFLGAMVWPVFALAYGAYRVTHRKVA